MQSIVGATVDGTPAKPAVKPTGSAVAVHSFSANRLASSQCPLQCRDLVGHNASVKTVEVSQDGAYLVSCGDDSRILLWSMNDILNGRQTAPKVMDKKHPRGLIHCVAITPDNS